jgi:protein-disulfide isomerase
MIHDTPTGRGAIALEPIDDGVDHVRGVSTAAHLILEYGDYECPYARKAYREIQRVETRVGDRLRFAFRHFPLTKIHPHALAAARAAEAAALENRFWEMHNLLFRRQSALEDVDLRHYAAIVGLNLERFDRDRTGPTVMQRIGRDVESGLASREVRGTPTIFIDGAVHRGAYDAATLIDALTGARTAHGDLDL